MIRIEVSRGKSRVKDSGPLWDAIEEVRAGRSYVVDEWGWKRGEGWYACVRFFPRRDR